MSRRACGSGGEEVAARLDARPPTYVAILKPDHIRHVDAFTSRYGVPAYGPLLYLRHDVPAADLRPIRRGSELPGGLPACRTGAASSRRRCGCPSSARSCSRTG